MMVGAWCVPIGVLPGIAETKACLSAAWWLVLVLVLVPLVYAMPPPPPTTTTGRWVASECRRQ